MLKELERLVKEWERIPDRTPEPPMPDCPRIHTQADLENWKTAMREYKAAVEA